MKFSEEQLVDELIKDVIHNFKKRQETITDLTQEQAYSLFEKYGNFSRILLVFPKTLLSNKKFLINCMKKFNIDTFLYSDVSLLTEVDYVLECLELGEYILDRLIKHYDILPKKDLFFIPIIKSSVEHEYFKEVSELINKILENKDLKNQKKFLKSININLKVVTNNSNNIIAELLKMSTTKNVKNQVKKWENKNNDENKNLQV